MAVIKCKMCGGDLDIAENVTVAECEYCGTKQTVPTAMNENLQNLFNRANTLRIKSEFDKAEKLYEKIIQADTTQSDAYWGLILCKYGIEYVDDPVTFKKIPTCHRASYDSIIADDDYKSAIENADMSQRTIYEEQAKEIDRIQKDILALAQKEETYDVFICYKETDADGKRTQDSVIANDIYYQLTQEGYKVFYAAITLEGKLGSAYEPIIFAALNSAKVMLSIGTKPEYFNAVWVKNEWSRFLKIIQKDRSKLLIPCYRDMDAYELPEEFAHLQAHDMAKIGFINDLIRGIKKVVKKDEPEQNIMVKETVVSGESANIAPLLKRVFMFLEDGDWNNANEYCERVLDIDPENADAYLGKLMAELRARKKESLKDSLKPFDSNNNYLKIIRFGDDQLREELTGYIEYIKIRNENARLDGIYTRATEAMSSAKTEVAYKEAAKQFETISEYKDSAQLIKECYEKAEIVRKDAIYISAKEKMSLAKTEMQYRNAAEQFETINGYKDSARLIKECYEKAKAAQKDAILATGKNTMSGGLVSDYENAIKHFEFIPGWKDADKQRAFCQQKIEEINAIEAMKSREKERKAKRRKRIAIIVPSIMCAIIAAFFVYTKVIIPNGEYNEAVALMDAGDVVAAYEAWCSIGDFRDSKEMVKSICDEYRKVKLENIKVGDYLFFGEYEQDNRSSNGKEAIEWLVLDKKKDGKVLVISKYALDCWKYDTKSDETRWSNSSLRSFLNNTVKNYAFSADEKALISTVTISEYDAYSGNKSEDQIFLLSEKEIRTYLTFGEARQCKPTKYAAASGMYVNNSGNCDWWLRTLATSRTAYYINAGGIIPSGDVNESMGVRPAMWIDPNA